MMKRMSLYAAGIALLTGKVREEDEDFDLTVTGRIVFKKKAND